MISAIIATLVILYLMGSMTIYELYYPILLNNTTHSHRNDVSVKKVNGLILLLNDKFYCIMWCYVIYVYLVLVLLLPNISSVLLCSIIHIIFIVSSLVYLYIQRYPLIVYENAILEANKHLKS